jgi:hypothetical protein
MPSPPTSRPSRGRSGAAASSAFLRFNSTPDPFYLFQTINVDGGMVMHW